MIRTVVSLEDEDKAWLDRKAEENQVSMAEVVRQAVRRYREESDREAQPLRQLLQATSGIWKGEDGLAYQRRIRREWDERVPARTPAACCG